jgi:hypothetical protein
MATVPRPVGPTCAGVVVDELAVDDLARAPAWGDDDRPGGAPSRGATVPRSSGCALERRTSPMPTAATDPKAGSRCAAKAGRTSTLRWEALRSVR